MFPRAVSPRVGPALARLVRQVVTGSIVACSAGAGVGGTQGCPASPAAPMLEECPDEQAPDAAAPSRSLEPGGVVQGDRASTFELTTRAGERARVLRVTVDELENPQRRNLVLVIRALLPAQPIELGRLSFFPANQAGTFVLPLPASVAGHVARQRALTIRCTLEADGDAGLDGVRLRLRSLALEAEP